MVMETTLHRMRLYHKGRMDFADRLGGAGTRKILDLRSGRRWWTDDAVVECVVDEDVIRLVA